MWGGSSQICFDKDGASVGAELGLGGGSSASVTDEGLKDSGWEVEVEANGTCLGFGGSVGPSIDNCGRVKCKLKGGLYGVSNTLGDCDGTKPLPTEIKDTFWKGAQKLLECKLGLKGSAKFCQKKKF